MTKAPSPREFVAALSPALRQGAAIACALEGRVKNRPKSGETRAAKAALTIADTATQEALLVPLFESFPNLHVEAEEDTPTAGRFPPDGPGHVVIDPIDGTLHSYLDGRGLYAVMLGLAIDGRYEAGLVALPREDLFFEGVRGEGARWARGNEEMRPIALEEGGDQVLVSHELPEPIAGRLRECGYRIAPASGGAIAVAPLIPGACAGLRVAVGSAGISRRGRIGVLIAREAGAAANDENGDPFPTDLDTPARALIVTANERDRENLLWALAAAA